MLGAPPESHSETAHSTTLELLCKGKLLQAAAHPSFTALLTRVPNSPLRFAISYMMECHRGELVTGYDCFAQSWQTSRIMEQVRVQDVQGL